jgi:hypothetical protein
MRERKEGDQTRPDKTRPKRTCDEHLDLQEHSLFERERLGMPRDEANRRGHGGFVSCGRTTSRADEGLEADRELGEYCGVKGLNRCPS